MADATRRLDRQAVDTGARDLASQPRDDHVEIAAVDAYVAAIQRRQQIVTTDGVARPREQRGNDGVFGKRQRDDRAGRRGYRPARRIEHPLPRTGRSEAHTSALPTP